MEKIYFSAGDITAFKNEVATEVAQEVAKLQSPPIPKGSDLLTRAETANLLRISLSTLARHIRSGVIPASKVGRRVLIRRSSLEKALLSINN